MTEEQLNNINKPELVDWEPTANEAIKAINRILESNDVEDDDYADAMVVKAFIVDTLPNTPVQPRMSKTIPVMETTIEGAQKRIDKAIQDYADRSKFIGDPRETNPDLEYIGVFLDTVGDEMAAISSAHNSLHDRYVQALAAIDEWKDNFEAVDMAASRHLEEKVKLQREITELRRENGELRRSNAASLSSIHAAHDNR